MLRRVFLSLVFGLTASCANAQAPSPADVGISKGTPDVFKLKGNDNVWTPFGSVNSATHVFIPGTNGAIAPNDCVKWGPGLTSAGAACNSVTGGAHPANQLTIYTSHSGLVNNVTTPTEAWTVQQQGFYASGDGGDATYNWSFTSYCRDGTSGSPGLADGIICVLPIGQSPSTAGRYLLQNDGSINVRQVGMQPSTATNLFDNSPFVQTLMNAISSPASQAGGYDVIFSGTVGQPYTEYYFSDSFVVSQGAHYRCNGAAGVYKSIILMFAAGKHGWIDEDNKYVPGGGNFGFSELDGCQISTQSYGQATTAANSSTITITGMALDPARIIPPTVWHNGDGILVAPPANPLYFPESAVGAGVQPGAYVSAVSGSTLTLASGYKIHPQIAGFANIAFIEAGTNNFVAGDTIQVSNNTFTAAASGTAAGTFQIGANWAAAVNNLISAINTNAAGATWGAPLATPNISAAVFNTMTQRQVVFTALALGTAGNSYPALYTPASTAAGRFQKASYTDDQQTNFIGGVSTATQGVAVWQLPVALKYTVQTTAGSSSVLVTAGPRLLVPGEIVWSDAFPFGSTIAQVSGTLGNQTLVMTDAFNNVPQQNALVTHPSGSPGQMWTLPAGHKRDTYSTSHGNWINNWVFGLLMSCATNNGLNCTGAKDENNSYYNGLVGRWLAGDNTGESISIQEGGSVNFMMDLFDGGSVGETTINFFASSVEDSHTMYGLMGNCVSTNSSTLLGGYIVNRTDGCAAEVGVIPPTPGSPWLGVGVAAPVGAPTIIGAPTVGRMYGPWTVAKGTDAVSVNFSGYTLGLTHDSGNNVTGFAFNASLNGYEFSSNGISTYQNYIGSGYNGYYGAGGSAAYSGFPTGIMLYNSEIGASNLYSRLLSMEQQQPTAPWHLWGDFTFNTQATPGGNAGWMQTPTGSSATLSAPVVKGVTTSATVSGCLSPAPAVGTPIDTLGAPLVFLGTYSSCSGTTLIFGAAAAANAPAGDAVSAVQQLPAAPISNDPAGTHWTLGNTMTLTPVALASLPATCTPGTFAAISNGVASPTYNAAVGATTGAATDPVFCTNGNVWTYH